MEAVMFGSSHGIEAKPVSNGLKNGRFSASVFTHQESDGLIQAQIQLGDGRDRKGKSDFGGFRAYGDALQE